MFFIIANTTTAGTTAPKTPPHGIDSGPKLKSTPFGVGSTAIWPQEGWPAIPQKVYEIAKKDEEGKMKHHIPGMAWFHKSEDTSTVNIRRMLGLEDAERGRCVLYINVFRKLYPITDLSEDEFLSTWWHIVICHYTL
ncbi:hypothetical protein BDR03DRAFT_1009999 [Suillus americanus]|nr:hypothetical protein BDR03DRAFT_1009999 [Suillus americanus]